ncbi:MAG TPA: TonB-dependent receptor [Luteibaculaceae bacterium]|nr:TonB-dependent receptor [Luteibaculaceae bacterium]
MIGYKIKRKIAVLTVLLFGGVTQAQISGRVIDQSTGELLPGASIQVENTSTGTASDATGAFTLPANVDKKSQLVIQMLGYEVKRVPIPADGKLTVALQASQSELKEVVVSSRRRSEELQKIPVSVSVVGSREINNSVAFNVNRVKELLPSVQLYSSNPRNTTLNIRGIGSTYGLTNDGIDPGVGFYVDGVYYARPAAATLDFIDVQQVEVIKGSQGTLFGKNTVAGTFNVTSKEASFFTSGIWEQAVGNLGFVQSKGSLTGALIKDKLAGRISFTGTHRDGTLYNTVTQEKVNSLSNLGFRGQLLWILSKRTKMRWIADWTRQRPNGYAQVYAGVTRTQRAEFRQFEAIARDLNYAIPNPNPFNRQIDHDTPWRSNQDMGGISAQTDVQLNRGTLTFTSAWRSWLWGPSNDRDFTGLQALARSEAPSVHHQWSQEARYSGEFGNRVKGVLGFFAFYQQLEAVGAHVEESGKDQWRFAQTNQNALWQTPGLLDGYGIRTNPSFYNFSGALFGQFDVRVTDKWVLIPGIRLNYDQKAIDFKRVVYGGLSTTDSTLLSFQRSVYTNQSFSADVDDWNSSGQFSVQYNPSEHLMAFATGSLGFKPVGLNLGGLPTQNGQPMIELAVIKPERARHFEVGFKSEPIKNLKINASLFRTDVFNYQTLVQSPQLGVNRGYLANAEQVRTEGVELELAGNVSKTISFTSSVTYLDARYITFTNAPLPLEETGKTVDGKQVAFADISGGVLPGVSKWNASASVEWRKEVRVFNRQYPIFAGADVFYRSGFSSSPSPSKVLNIEAYQLVNARAGINLNNGFSVLLWTRNVFNKDYFEQLLPAAGNTGHYAGVLGDPRTYGITLRYSFAK